MQRFILMGLLCFLFACKETNDGLFVPQNDMTQEQIVDLLEDAIKNTISSSEISCTFRNTTNKRRIYPYSITDEYKIDYQFSLNKQTHKSLKVEVYKKNDYYDMNFRFVDGYNEYEYLQSENELHNTKLPDVFWSHYRCFCNEKFELQCYKYSWTIKGKSFIGKNEQTLDPSSGYNNINEVLEITLTKDLKINNFYSNSQIDHLYDKRNCFCTYTANPKMPQGYNISDFSPIPQYEVKIIWENGKENIFYTDYQEETGVCQFHSSTIDLYIASPSGKVLQLFYDENYMQPVVEPIVLADITFYAKWVTL